MKYEFPKERIEFDKNLKDNVNVPINTLLTISLNDSVKDLPQKLIQPLKGMKKRDWFVDHAYFCLPLSMMNQHGFIVKSHYDFSVYWNGSIGTDGVIVKHWGSEKEQVEQRINSHFGMGTFTIQNPWTFRTPKGVNLMIMNPPNFFIDGIIHMSAIVETDQLRRDFTFNLKITRPNEWILIKRGTPIGYVLPYPRYFIDEYELKHDEEILSKEDLENERQTSLLHGRERKEIDTKYAGAVGLRYMLGEDIYGNKFENHQRSLSKKNVGCPFGFKSKEINTKDIID
jgi:hypothetical protein